MKGTLLSIAFIAGTISIFLLTVSLVASANDPIIQEIGPYTPHYWSNGYTSYLDGSYSLENTSYFELRNVTNPNDAHQSELQPPEIGEKKGEYTITNLKLEGDWSISRGAKIFTLTDTTITLTPKTGEIAINAIYSLLFGICLWIVFMAVLAFLS